MNLTNFKCYKHFTAYNEAIHVGITCAYLSEWGADSPYSDSTDLQNDGITAFAANVK